MEKGSTNIGEQSEVFKSFRFKVDVNLENRSRENPSPLYVFIIVLTLPQNIYQSPWQLFWAHAYLYYVKKVTTLLLFCHDLDTLVFKINSWEYFILQCCERKSADSKVALILSMSYSDRQGFKKDLWIVMMINRSYIICHISWSCQE